jgi:membrane-associated phospholipid phosphatase
VFQTEPILWLQSHGSPPLTALLSLVTLLGYMPAYVAALLGLAFAVRLRPGLAVLGGVLLAGLLADGLKDAVAFPRPDEVDARVAPTFATKPLELDARGGATSFWSRPRPEAIAAVRRRGAGNYGFPSGHVAAATSFLLCAAYFFRSRQALAAAGAWVPLMALSRMYLGRHFLADVLGGLAIGLAATGLAILLFRPLDEERPPGRKARLAFAPATLVSLTLCALAPWQPLLRPEYVGVLAGLVASCAFLLATGLAAEGGTRRQRALRVAIAGLVLVSGLAATRALTRLPGPPSARAAAVAATLLVAAATFAGTTALSRRLGLYPEEPCRTTTPGR